MTGCRRKLVRGSFQAETFRLPSHKKERNMFALIKESLAKTVSHFGLMENGKPSFKGLASFSYQALAVVMMVSLMLFLPGARMEAGFLSVILISLAATVAIIAGVKLAIFIAEGVCKRVRESFKNKIVGNVVSAI